MAVTVSTAAVAGNRRRWQTATGIPPLSCGDELLPHDPRRTVPRGESVQKQDRRLL